MNTEIDITENRALDRSQATRNNSRMKRASGFKQSDVERAIRAATKAGLAVGTVEVTAEGTIRVLTAQAAAEASANDAFGMWKAKQC